MAKKRGGKGNKKLLTRKQKDNNEKQKQHKQNSISLGRIYIQENQKPTTKTPKKQQKQ